MWEHFLRFGASVGWSVGPSVGLCSLRRDRFISLFPKTRHIKFDSPSHWNHTIPFILLNSIRERMAIISGDMSDLQSKLTNAQVDVNNRLSGEALQRAEDFSRFQASLEQVQMVANGSVSEQKVCIHPIAEHNQTSLDLRRLFEMWV